MNPHTIIGILTAALLAATVTAQPDQPGVALTIYSTAQPGGVPAELYNPAMSGRRYRPDSIPGYAMVRQQRPIDLTAGVTNIRFTDVAAMIDPTTVSFASLTDPDHTTVIEQSYEFDLLSPDKLLAKYLDRKVTIVRGYGDGSTEKVTGTLLAADGDKLILRTESQTAPIQIVSQSDNVRSISVAELPGGLITKPTLVWQIHAAQPGQHLARVTYQTAAMTWWTDYNLTFAEGKTANKGTLDVGAWVSIINRSGTGYDNAKLKLIAGDVQRAPSPRPERRYLARAVAMDASEAVAGFQEKAFFEYHLYTLARPTSIPNNSTRQIELFTPARNVPCEKVLVYYGAPSMHHWAYRSDPMLDRNLGTESNKKVDVYLRFKNEQDAGLGIPLPAGRIRVSKLDPADGSLEFIGEDVLDHTPKDEEVLIKLGSAFDVVGERKQTDFASDRRARTLTESYEIKLRNHKDQRVTVLVKENLFRWANWTITAASHDYDKIDSRTIHFPVTIDPDDEVTITYTVRYTW